MHPEIQDRVYREIEEVLENSSRPISLEDLPKFEYLEMVLKETLRIFPSVAVLGRQPSEDIKLGLHKLHCRSWTMI